jgi:hypothetical protein
MPEISGNVHEKLTTRMHCLLDFSGVETSQLQIWSLSEDLELIASGDEARARLQQFRPVG